MINPAAPHATLLLAALQEKLQGHSALLHGLGAVGDVSPAQLPWLLRLAHVKATHAGADSAAALAESARGLQAWRAALDRGLLPDDEAIEQLTREGESFTLGFSAAELKWPEEPLRTIAIRGLSKLGVAHFAHKYPAVKEALLKSVLELVVAYHKQLLGIQEVGLGFKNS